MLKGQQVFRNYTRMLYLILQETCLGYLLELSQEFTYLLCMLAWLHMVMRWFSHQAGSCHDSLNINLDMPKQKVWAEIKLV